MYNCCFLYKQKTAYEMRISDWSSDVCSSDLVTEKVPNPTRRTSSPRFNAPEIVSKTDSTALPASVRLRPVASATEPISSCLFMPVGTPKLDVDGDSPGAAAGISERALSTRQKESGQKSLFTQMEIGRAHV